MILPLLLSQTLYEAMAGDCVARYPDEACGILIGRDGANREITEVRPAANVWHRDSERRNRFLLDPADQLRAERDAAAAGLEVLGFYHSHPDAPPVPSERDRDAAWPFYSYVIVGVTAGTLGDVRCWQFDEAARAFASQLFAVAEVDA